MADIILITKRHDYISEVVAASKDKFVSGLQDVWIAAKAKNELHKYILRDFQLELKNITEWDDDKLRIEQARFADARKMKKYIQSIYETNSVIYEGEHKVVSDDADVLGEFVHSTYLSIARELWKRPNIMQDIMEKKERTKNLEYLEKIVVQAIKGTLRRGHRNLEMLAVEVCGRDEFDIPRGSRSVSPVRSAVASSEHQDTVKSICVNSERGANDDYQENFDEDHDTYEDDATADVVDDDGEFEDEHITEDGDAEEEYPPDSHRSSRHTSRRSSHSGYEPNPSVTASNTHLSAGPLPTTDNSNYIDALLFNPKAASRSVSIVSSRSNSPSPASSRSSSRKPSMHSPSRSASTRSASKAPSPFSQSRSSSRSSSSSSSSPSQSARRGRSKERKVAIHPSRFRLNAMAKYNTYYASNRPMVRKSKW